MKISVTAVSREDEELKIIFGFGRLLLGHNRATISLISEAIFIISRKRNSTCHSLISTYCTCHSFFILLRLFVLHVRPQFNAMVVAVVMATGQQWAGSGWARGSVTAVP
ncbi:MAG: hypothetical protein GY874_13815 [Desulfobacteraceae bacterium]|nr:hypothetical protein [Desulfobacteraceae bacterium]